MKTQPAENVNKTGSLHRGLSLLFGKIEVEVENSERNARHDVEEEVKERGKTAETEGRLVLLSQLEREKIDFDKEFDKFAHPRQLFSAVVLTVRLIIRSHGKF